MLQLCTLQQVSNNQIVIFPGTYFFQRYYLFKGLVGTISVAFFDYQDGIFYAGDTLDSWYKLAVQLLGIIAIGAWTTVWSFLLFGMLRLLKLLRIDRETEFRGNDLLKHGESAYPADAWVELQYTMARGM